MDGNQTIAGEVAACLSSEEKCLLLGHVKISGSNQIKVRDGLLDRIVELVE